MKFSAPSTNICSFFLSYQISSAKSNFVFPYISKLYGDKQFCFSPIFRIFIYILVQKVLLPQNQFIFFYFFPAFFAKFSVDKGFFFALIEYSNQCSAVIAIEKCCVIISLGRKSNNITRTLVCLSHPLICSFHFSANKFNFRKLKIILVDCKIKLDRENP